MRVSVERGARTFTVAALMLMAALPAASQPANPVPGPAPNPARPATIVWSGAAGVESFSLRDVARSGPPVDASPIAWTGNGPAIAFRVDRSRATRLHRIEIGVASYAGFSYETPIGMLPTAAGDRASRLEGSYEYRRYPFTNLLVRGLDAGIGVRGFGERLAFTRQLPASIEIGETDSQLAVSAVLAARFRRWSRFSAELAWGNAAALARSSARHDVASSSSTSWGGGWVTDLQILAETRVARHASILVSWLHADQGLLSDHHGYVSGRRQLVMGITYGR